MTRAMSLVLVQLLFFGRGAARADSSVLYVSTAGSDQNPCTVALPCASLDRATTLAQPLDTVEVASGVYGPQHIYAAGAQHSLYTGCDEDAYAHRALTEGGHALCAGAATLGGKTGEQHDKRAATPGVPALVMGMVVMPPAIPDERNQVPGHDSMPGVLVALEPVMHLRPGAVSSGHDKRDNEP
jgi:hypothetical protein